MENSTKRYDYIIAGAGCAGLSLAMQLKLSNLNFSKILLIDKVLKNLNDRTWCFWTKEQNNWFDAFAFKKWEKFVFKTNDFEKEMELSPYSYIMIKGIDFYNFCLEQLRTDPRFEIVTDEIQEIVTTNDSAKLITGKKSYYANYIFNSAFRKVKVKKGQINYVQHFKGWVIETDKPAFDLDCPVFMDFDINQYNDCRFVYVVPHSANKALIEYTGFSPERVNDEIYDSELKTYIEKKLNIGTYTITDIEKGEIPMYESEFINPYGARVINIGTAGGNSKPSTGYTFYFIQKAVKHIIEQLKNHPGKIAPLKPKKRFSYYDKILLEVLNKKELSAQDVFRQLFQKNEIKDLLAFLNEESSLKQDLGIMNSVPKKQFLIAAIKKLK